MALRCYELCDPWSVKLIQSRVWVELIKQKNVQNVHATLNNIQNILLICLHKPHSKNPFRVMLAHNSKIKVTRRIVGLDLTLRLFVMRMMHICINMSIKPTTDNRLCIDLRELFTYLLLCNLFIYVNQQTISSHVLAQLTIIKIVLVPNHLYLIWLIMPHKYIAIKYCKD